MPGENATAEDGPGVYSQLSDRERKTFTQVTFRADYSDRFDTAQRFTQRYDAARRVRETTLFEYADMDKDREEPLFAGVNSRLSEGSRIVYQYNAAGLPVSIKTYQLQPANSVPALYSFILGQAAQERGPYWRSGNDESDASREARRKRYQRMADSLKKHGIPELAVLSNDEELTYNEDGNPVLIQNPVEKNSTRYSYIHQPDGRVQSQRGFYVSTANSERNPYFSVSEKHFTYSPSGKILTYKLYSSERDSVNVATPEHLLLSRTNHYNGKDLLDAITYIQRGSATEHHIEYTDTFRAAYSIMAQKLANHTGGDVLSRTLYTYEKGLLATELTIGYPSSDDRRNGNSHYDSTQTNYYYDASGELTETRTYRKPQYEDKPMAIEEQSLFFSGDRGDAAIAKRSLALKFPPQRRKPSVAVRPRPRTISRKPEPTPVPPTAGDPNGIDPGIVDPPGIVEAPPSPAIFTYVEQMPEFPNGGLNDYLASNLHHVPGDSSCRVVVKFVVQEDGSITDAIVVRGSGTAACDEEALRVVRSMPKWKPGKQNGKAVPVNFTLPVQFRRMDH
jgi:TonB family protein